MLHNVAQKDVGVMFANKPMLHRRGNAAGSQQVTPQRSHLGKRKAGHRATSFLVILELVDRKGISFKTLRFVTLPRCRGHLRTGVGCVV